MSQEITMKQFVNRFNIRIVSEGADNNPNMDNGGVQMNHYKVTLFARVNGKRRQYTLFYSMGIGLRGDPEAADVLDCLASDASGVENARDFADWAYDLGYEMKDLNKARRTYEACQRESAALKRLLGADGYELLLYKTERL